MTSNDIKYDVVLSNGRVIDPESKFDQICDVGVANGTIQAICTETLAGRVTLDAQGLIVSPGFIDLNSHGQNEENYSVQAKDGVTTSLALERGTNDVGQWYDKRQGSSLINYGTSIGHMPVRMNVMHEQDTFLPVGDGAYRAASETEIEEMKRQIKQGLERGALAVGYGIQYTPGASHWEILEMFRVAAQFNALCYVHIRHQGEKEPMSSIRGLEEVVAAAAITGVPVHVTHIHSISLRSTPRLLQMICEAQSHGVDITTDCYPYTASMTDISSALFDEGWKQVLGIGYSDLEWAATGERLTIESFKGYRKMGGLVIMHALPESLVQSALASALTMIASDGLLEKGKGHPRTSGTYSRLLGRYVRETETLKWMDALRKITLMPAQRLEERVPMMKNKGRIRIGADADLTVFDPEHVIDKSTYQDPAEYSEGIKHVLVKGIPVVQDGQLQYRITPGQPIRASSL